MGLRTAVTPQAKEKFRKTAIFFPHQNTTLTTVARFPIKSGPIVAPASAVHMPAIFVLLIPRYLQLWCFDTL